MNGHQTFEVFFSNYFKSNYVGSPK